MVRNAINTIANFKLDSTLASLSVSLAEIKDAVETLAPGELAELASVIRKGDNAAWHRQIDEEFAEDGGFVPFSRRCAITSALAGLRSCRDRQGGSMLLEMLRETTDVCVETCA
jgi:hypothetical protein